MKVCLSFGCFAIFRQSNLVPALAQQFNPSCHACGGDILWDLLACYYLSGGSSQWDQHQCCPFLRSRVTLQTQLHHMQTFSQLHPHSHQSTPAHHGLRHVQNCCYNFHACQWPKDYAGCSVPGHITVLITQPPKTWRAMSACRVGIDLIDIK